MATVSRVGMNCVQHGIGEQKPRLNESGLGGIFMQTALCMKFLQIYGTRLGLACLTGTGSQLDEPVRYLDSKVSKEDV